MRRVPSPNIGTTILRKDSGWALSANPKLIAFAMCSIA